MSMSLTDFEGDDAVQEGDLLLPVSPNYSFYIHSVVLYIQDTRTSSHLRQHTTGKPFSPALIHFEILVYFALIACVISDSD